MNNVLNRGICTRAENYNADDENSSVEKCQCDILGGREAPTLPDELEPEQRGEVEGKAGDEEGGDEAEERVEEGDSFGDDPANDCYDGDQAEPDSPAARTLDVADWRVRESTIHDVSPDDGAVDRAGDEDNGQSDTKGDTRNGVAG